MKKLTSEQLLLLRASVTLSYYDMLHGCTHTGTQCLIAEIDQLPAVREYRNHMRVMRFDTVGRMQ